MATTERYTTVIELNSEQAKRNLDELRRKVESWKSDLAEAREKKMGRSFIAAIRKELKDAEKKLKQMRSSYSNLSAQEQMEAELAGLKLHGCVRVSSDPRPATNQKTACLWRFSEILVGMRRLERPTPTSRT